MGPYTQGATALAHKKLVDTPSGRRHGGNPTNSPGPAVADRPFNHGYIVETVCSHMRLHTLSAHWALAAKGKGSEMHATTAPDSQQSPPTPPPIVSKITLWQALAQGASYGTVHFVASCCSSDFDPLDATEIRFPASREHLARVADETA